MFQPHTVFQRSRSGREEIYQKKCGLTQSERQVLIMIDGVTPCGDIREKLSSLRPERFERALATLRCKELILEVFMPVAGQQADEVESTVIARFLQQDPTDPVTIISFDPDEEFGNLSAASPEPAAPAIAAAAPPPTASIPELPVHAAIRSQAAPQSGTVTVMDENLIAQVDMLAAEVRAARREAEQATAAVTLHMPAAADFVPIGAPLKPRRLHWGYGLILLGLGCFVVFFWGRLRA